MAEILWRSGCDNLYLYDFDTVSELNLVNQIWYPDDIGKPKGQVIYDKLKSLDPTRNIKWFNKKVDGSAPLNGITFLLTDTMESRKEIYEGALKNNVYSSLVIETRLGIVHGEVNIFNPCNTFHQEQFESILFDDEDEEVMTSACGGKTAIMPIATITASRAVQWLFDWANDNLFANHFEFVESTMPSITKTKWEAA